MWKDLIIKKHKVKELDNNIDNKGIIMFRHCIHKLLMKVCLKEKYL